LLCLDGSWRHHCKDHLFHILLHMNISIHWEIQIYHLLIVWIYIQPYEWYVAIFQVLYWYLMFIVQVRIQHPSDDLLPDFLAIGNNKTLNSTSLPNEVHSSDNGDVHSITCIISLVHNSQITVQFKYSNLSIVIIV
jgi:hypothetical protein